MYLLLTRVNFDLEEVWVCGDEVMYEVDIAELCEKNVWFSG